MYLAALLLSAAAQNVGATKYDTSAGRSADAGIINVHIVPHTHDE